jgi:hypothetical protein
MSPRNAAATLSILAISPLPTLATAQSAAAIVFADGCREAASAPRRDSKGQWTAIRNARRTVLRPGNVVVVVDDEGGGDDHDPGARDHARTASDRMAS